MHQTCQDLVNAQVSVNRAVFEANRTIGSDDYLMWCIAEALGDLSSALQRLARKGKRRGVSRQK